MIFEKIYKDYLDQVAAIDCSIFAEKLGIRVSGKNIEIPFFNQIFTITPAAITDGNGNKPHHAVCVILCKYLLSWSEMLTHTKELATYNSIFKFLGNLFKSKAVKNFDHRHTGRIPRIKIFFQRRSWAN